MSEQALDLQSTWAILRRHRRVLATAALIGAAAGVAFVVVRPPMYSSSSMVLLPPAQDSSGEQVERDVQTEVRIASSDVVLDPAGESVSPTIEIAELARLVTITAPTSDVVKIEVEAPSAARAEELAQAVAEAEIDYLGSAIGKLRNVQQIARDNRIAVMERTLETVNRDVQRTTTRRDAERPGTAAEKAFSAALAQLTAQQASIVLQIDQVRDQSASWASQEAGTLIQAASPARRPGLTSQYVIFGLIGMLAVSGLVAMLLALFGRRDRRLRFRDEIADALGSAVIASIHSRPAKTVAGWSALLEGYTPRTVDAWALRQALRHLVPGDFFGPHHDDTGEMEAREPVVITVLCLSEDPGALAMGPQIASYAASAGVSTRVELSMGHDSAAALWAACARVRGREQVRPHLWVGAGSGRDRDEPRADLTIVLAVVDRKQPGPLELTEHSVTILAVSSGSATAEDLARTAVAADVADCRIAGVVVADPDGLDRTTGRLLQTERSQEALLPTRLTGVVSPGSVTGMRRSWT